MSRRTTPHHPPEHEATEAIAPRPPAPQTPTPAAPHERRPMRRHHPIGEAARLTGLSPDTLRYYERIGLLPPVARDAGGRRRYSEADLARLQFIRRAQHMDFSLAEIARLLALREHPEAARAEARELTRAKLADIEARLAALTALRDELALLLRRCERGEGCGCPIVAGLEGPQRPLE